MKLLMDDPIVQCDLCNAELTVTPSDLVDIVKAWEKGTGDGVTVKQVTEICLWVYGSNVERAMFLMLKRGELEITGVEKGQPLLRVAKKDVKPVEVSQPVTAPKPMPKPTPKPTSISQPKPPQNVVNRLRYDWKLGEQLWNEDKGVNEIAKALGCAVSAVKNRARARWKRREKKPRTPKKKKVRKKKPKPDVELVQSKFEGQSVGKKASIRRDKRDAVMCPDCLKNTTSFPCEHCESTHPKLHARMLSP